MATIPSALYPGQIDTSDPTGYPQGKAKNVAVAGDGTGTPLEKAWVNDLFGFWQALLASAGITPTGTPDKVGASQYLDAINTRIGTAGNFRILGDRLFSDSYSGHSLLISSQDTSPRGLFFKSDGTKFFTVGSSADSVYQYSCLPLTPWSLLGATYDSVSFSVAAQTTSPVDIIFNATGTKFFVLSDASILYQYSAGSPWALPGSSYDSVSFDMSAQNLQMRGVAFNDNGTKLIACGQNTPTSVFQYNLPTPYTLVSASFDSISVNISATVALPQGLVWSSNGKSVFIAAPAGITQWSVTAAYVLTGLAYTGVSLLPAETGSTSGIYIKPDGTKLFTSDSSTASLYEYYTSRVVAA